MQDKSQEGKGAGPASMTSQLMTSQPSPVLYVDCLYLRTYFRGDHFKNDLSKKRFQTKDLAIFRLDKYSNSQNTNKL